MKSSSHRFIAYLLIASLALIWGSSFILMERGLDAFSPLQVAAFRIAIAGFALLPFLRQSLKAIDRRAWLWILLVGIIGNAIPAFLFTLAETVITPASAGILNALSPVFALLIGAGIFGFAFSRLKLTGVLISFTGAVVLIMAGSDAIDLHTHLLYSALVVLATACYGLSVNLIKKYLQAVSALHISTLALIAVGIPYAGYLLVSDAFEVLTVHPQGWSSLGYVSILAVVGTSMALIFFNRLVQLTDPVIAASVTYLIPIVALGWDLLDGKSVFTGQLVGMAVILTGVWLVNKA